VINVALLFSQLSGTQTSERKRQPIERLAKPDFGATAAKANFVHIAVIGSTKMLRSIANVRFGEAAPQRRNRLRMSAKGR